MDENKMEEFSKLSDPISKFLKENHHPYCTAVIDSHSAKIVETIGFIPQKENAHCGE